MPGTDQYTVVLLVLPDDNPASFNKEQAKSGEPLGVPLGRLGKADANKWAEAFAGRSIRAVVYLKAKPGTSGSAQVRFRPAPPRGRGRARDIESGGHCLCAAPARPRMVPRPPRRGRSALVGRQSVDREHASEWHLRGLERTGRLGQHGR